VPLIPLTPPERLRPVKRGVLAAVLALVGHAWFVSLLLFLSLLKLNVPEPKKNVPARPVAMRGISSQQWAANRGDLQPTAKDEQEQPRREQARPVEKKKEKVPDQSPPGQVVDVAPGNAKVDPEAKYLAESNNAVKKETKAKEQTPFYRNAAPNRTSPTPQEGKGSDVVDRPQIAGNNGAGDDDRPVREAANKQKTIMEVPTQEARSEVAMREKNEGPGAEINNRNEAESMEGNSDRLRLQPGTAGSNEEGSSGKAGLPGVSNLMPSPAVLDKISGAAANDHLKDAEEGEGTYLNTKEWKYASFFNRVKQSVGMHWNPSAPLRTRDPSGNIYGGRDRYTVLNVTLNERGNVKEIFVEKSSGVDFLDLEAIKSFERAQPFPNPPPGLVKDDSAVKFSFGFFLEMSGTPKMKLFRQN
jgi:TonB family protein